MNKRIKRYLATAGVVTEVMGLCILPYSLSLKGSESISQNSIIEEQQIETTGVTYPVAGAAAILASVDLTLEEGYRIAAHEVQEKYKQGWTKTRVNVRVAPNTDSEILTVLEFNTPILFTKIEQNKKWVKIQYEDTTAYIARKYISKKEITYNQYEVPSNEGFKSYMDYRAITSTSSPQYKLQHGYAYTGNYGIRQVEGRYCSALGSYFDISIGQYFDLVLENGTVIPCIAGDAKADKDTDGNNLFTSANGCCSEFVIDIEALNSNAKRDGNISSCTEEWNSPVQYVRIYETNILE